MYNTNKYNSRFFNEIIDNSDTLIKKSDNIKKIKAEYKYYYYLPENAKRFFVQPFNLKIQNGSASYEMEKINTKNLAELFLFDNLNQENFSKVIEKIFSFKDKAKQKTTYSKKQSDYLVLQKTKNRISQIKNNSHEVSLFNRIENAYNTLSKKRKQIDLVLSHGDLCLSNILWINDLSMIKFIDPRGANRKKDIFMDSYYDLAKISHSVSGGYENILYGIDKKQKYLEDIFYNKINNMSISYELLKIYEASLFLSMIPLHINNSNNVFEFKRVCDIILKEVGF